MIKIKFENANGEETKFDPIGAINRKMKRYYENPNELLVDSLVVGGVTIGIERLAYALNAVTRAHRNFSR